MQKPTPSLLAALFITVFSTTAHASIDAYKNSWTAKALQLQREIDLDAPLNESTFIGTHNSFNAKSYQKPFKRYLDPNQLLSLYNQLEMGIRSLELDVHWTYNDSFNRDLLLCHALPNHLGCSIFDRRVQDGLQEIKKWLIANPNEVLLIYIERHLDGHEPRLAATLEKQLGPFLFKPSKIRQPSSSTCVSIPSRLTKADVLRAGKQVILVTKGCDGRKPHYEEQTKFKEKWDDYVFAGSGHIPKEPFTFLDPGMDEIDAYPGCGQQKAFILDQKHNSLWRVLENRTMLYSATHPNHKKKIFDNDMKRLVQCGINWPAMDMLKENDSRLRAAIWSWAPGFPEAGKGDCAIYKQNQGIQNTACDTPKQSFACSSHSTRAMKVMKATTTFEKGEGVCQQLGSDWHFTAPVNGRQMHALKEAMISSGFSEVALNYKVTKAGWRVNKIT